MVCFSWHWSYRCTSSNISKPQTFSSSGRTTRPYSSCFSLSTTRWRTRCSRWSNLRKRSLLTSWCNWLSRSRMSRHTWLSSCLLTKQHSRAKKKSTTTCPSKSYFTCWSTKTVQIRKKMLLQCGGACCWWLSKARWMQRLGTMCWQNPSFPSYWSPNLLISTATCRSNSRWLGTRMLASCTQVQTKRRATTT